MKTVGVLGGIGPQATIDFEARFHRAAQKLIPQLANGGYPPLIVSYFRYPPVLMRAGWEPALPMQPDPRLFETAKQLGGLVDFLVMPCNAIHLFVKEIEQAAGKPVLSMISLVLQEIERRGWKQVGVLGFRSPTVYTGELDKRGILWETIPGDLQSLLDEAILAVMEGRESPEWSTSAVAAVAFLRAFRAKSIDGIVLGCTEIPLLLGAVAEAPEFIHPVSLLAEAAVRHALE